MKKKYLINGLKIIFCYLSAYKRDLIILAILGLVSAAVNGVVPFLAGRLFDSILSPSKIFVGSKIEMPLFLFSIIVWGLARFIGDIVDWQSSLKSHRLDNIVHADYIVNAYSTILELPISFHKDQKMGEITSKINRAAYSLSRISSHVIINLAPQFLSIGVGLLIVFLIQPLLASILLLAVVIYTAILMKIVAPVAKLQKRGERAYSKAFGYAYDAVFNIQAVKQAVAEEHEQHNLFEGFRCQALRLWNKITTIWERISFSQRLIIMLSQLTIFVFSVLLIQNGQMTIGELVMFNGYAVMFFRPFVRLGYNWQTIQNGLVTLERAEKILGRHKEVYVPKKGIALSDIKGEVIFKNVSFAYRKKEDKVLDDISFRVKPGEVVALVGESGVGKSTLVDLISGYYFPQKGKVLIDGHDIKKLNLRFLRSKLAVVPQEVILFNDTIKKNIAYGQFSASEEEIKEAAGKSYAGEFIESFPKKYNQLVGEKGIKLSVGQKQRVAIARAILRDPRILILDEPTSALDPKSEKFIQESLEKLMKGRTTFIIAHRLSTVRKADRILVLDKGKIVEQGKHEELLKIPRGIYRHFYELQLGVL